MFCQYGLNVRNLYACRTLADINIDIYIYICVCVCVRIADQKWLILKARCKGERTSVAFISGCVF